MEIDPPAPSSCSSLPLSYTTSSPSTLLTHLTAALNQQDYTQALEVANEIEVVIQSGHWDAAQMSHTAESLLSIQLFLHFVLDDLLNARHLWRRIDSSHKDAPTPAAQQLVQVWALGKLLWNREIPEAYAAMTGGQWSAELQPLVEALRARVRKNELELLTRAYKRLKLPSLAVKLGCTPAEALQAAKEAGWHVDENKGEVEPVPGPVPKGEPIGLPQLQQLARYVLFLEAKSVTAPTTSA